MANSKKAERAKAAAAARAQGLETAAGIIAAPAAETLARTWGGGFGRAAEKAGRAVERTPKEAVRDYARGLKDILNDLMSKGRMDPLDAQRYWNNIAASIAERGLTPNLPYYEQIQWRNRRGARWEEYEGVRRRILGTNLTYSDKFKALFQAHPYPDDPGAFWQVKQEVFESLSPDEQTFVTRGTMTPELSQVYRERYKLSTAKLQGIDFYGWLNAQSRAIQEIAREPPIPESPYPRQGRQPLPLTIPRSPGYIPPTSVPKPWLGERWTPAARAQEEERAEALYHKQLAERWEEERAARRSAASFIDRAREGGASGAEISAASRAAYRQWGGSRPPVERPYVPPLFEEMGATGPPQWRDWFESKYGGMVRRFIQPEKRTEAGWGEFLKQRTPEIKEEWWSLGPYGRGERPSMYQSPIRTVKF